MNKNTRNEKPHFIMGGSGARGGPVVKMRLRQTRGPKRREVVSLPRKHPHICKSYVQRGGTMQT